MASEITSYHEFVPLILLISPINVPPPGLDGEEADLSPCLPGKLHLSIFVAEERD